MDEYEVGLEILKILHDNNYEAYFVGGFVRDHILGITSNDIDITSNATPEEVMELFNCMPVGIKFGTVLIDYKDYKFEHTTFRFDGRYIDSRHPNAVTFSNNVIDDLNRRDFTINQLLMDYNGKTIDYLNGIDDLNNKLIKCIGNPDTRFKEDALRMLRAFSFVSKLGFDIEAETSNSIKRNMQLLKNVSVERIRMEFDKISKGKNRGKSWKLFYEYGLNTIFPNMNVKLDNYNISFMQILAKNDLNTQIDDFWQISKQNIRIIKKAQELLNSSMSDFDLFAAGYEASKLAYTISHNDFDLRWNNLVIKSLKDLAIGGKDLKKIIKDNSINECLLYLSKKVLNDKIENDKSILLEEAKLWNISE